MMVFHDLCEFSLYCRPLSLVALHPLDKWRSSTVDVDVYVYFTTVLYIHKYRYQVHALFVDDLRFLSDKCNMFVAFCSLVDKGI